MEFDPEFGLVERGTAGHRASAQVVDVAAEIAALDRVKASPPYEDMVDRRFAAKLADGSFWHATDSDPFISWDEFMEDDHAYH